MRYVVDSLPSTPLDCPFCQYSLETDGFICTVSGQFSGDCSLFTESDYSHEAGKCNGLIEFETLSNKVSK